MNSHVKVAAIDAVNVDGVAAVVKVMSYLSKLPLGVALPHDFQTETTSSAQYQAKGDSYDGVKVFVKLSVSSISDGLYELLAVSTVQWSEVIIPSHVAVVAVQLLSLIHI